MCETWKTKHKEVHRALLMGLFAFLFPKSEAAPHGEQVLACTGLEHSQLRLKKYANPPTFEWKGAHVPH